MAPCFSLKIFVCLLIQVNLIYGKSQLIELDENDWDRMLSGEWMVEFFAPWCPACKSLQNTWENFSSWSQDLGVSVAQVDVTRSPGLSGRFMVTALPSIVHVVDGTFRMYKGAKDMDSFMSFIEEKKWRQLEPIPSWKSPSSPQMAVVAGFFKLSQVLRVVHNTLTEDYGFPTWASYLFFAVVTILLGALLGLVMVCCLDCFWPAKSSYVKVDKKEEKTSSESEGPEDELLDDQATSATTPSSGAARKRRVPKAD